MIHRKSCFNKLDYGGSIVYLSCILVFIKEYIVGSIVFFVLFIIFFLTNTYLLLCTFLSQGSRTLLIILRLICKHCIYFQSVQNHSRPPRGLLSQRHRSKYYDWHIRVPESECGTRRTSTKVFWFFVSYEYLWFLQLS